MNDLEKYFRSNDKRLIHKFYHYFEIYDRYFSKYRGQEITFLEIGIFQGGSLQMWKEYFGPKARIIGVDVNPRCKELEEDQIEIYIGSQSDRKFLRELKNKIPKVDILLDDGGHTMRQQIVTFEEMFEHVKEDGLFLCEDLHTSYFLKFGGGYKRSGTFIQYSKGLIDKLNSWFSEQTSFKVDEISRSIKGIHFYTSMLVIEKAKRERPKSDQTGNISLPPLSRPQSLGKRVWLRFWNLFLRFSNSVLRFFRLPSIHWGK